MIWLCSEKKKNDSRIVMLLFFDTIVNKSLKVNRPNRLPIRNISWGSTAIWGSSIFLLPRRMKTCEHLNRNDFANFKILLFWKFLIKNKNINYFKHAIVLIEIRLEVRYLLFKYKIQIEYELKSKEPFPYLHYLTEMPERFSSLTLFPKVYLKSRVN